MLNKSMIPLLPLITVLSMSVNHYSHAYELPTVTLSGEITQGGLIVGKTSSSNKVWLNKKLIKVSDKGNFAFGFSRDDKQSYQLKIVNADGKQLLKTLTPSKRKYNIQRVEGIKKSIMSPNPKAVARAQKDSKQVKEARSINSDIQSFAQGFIAPASGKITGVYGSQRFYNGVAKTPHYGLDYAGKKGTPVKAPADGKVVLNVPDMFYSGGTIIIDHGHGINSTFLHLSDSYVKVGDQVKQGDVVAAIGSTGRSTGPHLDWRVNWFNVRLDPALALKVNAIK